MYSEDRMFMAIGLAVCATIAAIAVVVSIQESTPAELYRDCIIFHERVECEPLLMTTEGR